MPASSKKSHLRSIAAYRVSKQAEDAQAHAKSTNKPRPQTRRQAHESTLQEAINSLTLQAEELQEMIQLVEAENDGLKRRINERNTIHAEYELRIREHVQQRELVEASLLDTQKSLIKAQEGLKTIQIRVRRVEREKMVKSELYQQQIQQTRRAEDKATKILADLSSLTISAKQQVSEVQIKSSLDLTLERRISTKLRRRIKQLDSQRRRVQRSLSDTRRYLDNLETWNSTKHGIYTPEARELARRILAAGCGADHVGEVIAACAGTFGIEIDRLPSRRTVLRCRDEGGFFGLIQLGREVAHAEATGGCSDGTTDRKITYESHHTTLKCPSYLPNVDDKNPSTWSHQTRFIKVEPAIDHTAKTQFEGTKRMAKEIGEAYSNSPLAKRDVMLLEVDDWIRKEEFQNMDHAADGKKKLELCVDWKKEVLTHDVGDEVIDYAETGEISRRLSLLTSEDLDRLKIEATSSLIPDAAALGRSALEAMPSSNRESLLAIRFAGCCAHKDMNSFKYGVLAMGEMWVKANLTPPVLLANKANTSTIRLGDVDSQAVQAAVEASTRGGMKATSLAGSLFNHSDDKKGYQDTHRNHMVIWKKKLYDETNYTRFPDTSSIRFQCNTYAAAELIVYHPLYVELIEEVTDGKIKSGFNHMESNLYRTLHDIPTLTELAAMALYGVSVSWPYLRLTRGSGTNSVPNLLDQSLIEMHQKLPTFCDAVAAEPDLLLLDTDKIDFTKATVDGRPWLNPSVAMTVRTIAPELPELKRAISAIFSGTAKGWRQFTQEFVPGGPFDSLTPELREKLFIPATNDVNEGSLGSWRVSRRSNPNLTGNQFFK